jgi:hydroxymethylbilane synthase
MMMMFRVGTRGSQLAVAQTQQVIDALAAARPDVQFARVVIKTTGDLRVGVPFAAVGTKGMFVKEIEEALLAGEVDLAVHSLKDLPGELPDGLRIGAVPPRADPRDALLSAGPGLMDLPAGARVGTSSRRRQALLAAARPDLTYLELRGNLDTRLRKLDSGQYDAIVLACAGLERLGLAHRIVERLSPQQSVPAPGQGALALEMRESDKRVRQLLRPFDDPAARDAVTAERAFQAALNGGCEVPAGAYATVDADRLWLTAVLAADGEPLRRTEQSGPRADAAAIGARAAAALLAPG